MIKSPLRYPGGKSRAVNLISTLIPDFQEFREPFLGGGSLFISLKQRFADRRFWVNDLYPELFKFWEMNQQQPDAVVTKVWQWREKFPEGKILHQFLKEKNSGFDDVERAAAFFIFNRISFSGTSLSGGFSERAFAERFTESSIERLAALKNVLSDTRITNLDYSDLVLAAGEGVFIFLDPPYFSATKSALYGKNGHLHKSFDHERFAATMKKCPHRWLITYDDSPFVRELFGFAHVIPFDLKYGMRNVSADSDQLGREVFISNFLERLP